MLARILPFTSNDVLGSKELFMFIEEKKPEEVLIFTALKVSETARVRVLIDLASRLDTIDTFNILE